MRPYMERARQRKRAHSRAPLRETERGLRAATSNNRKSKVGWRVVPVGRDGLLEAASGFEPVNGGFAVHFTGLCCWSLLVIVGSYPRVFRVSHTA
jgi:hypothetical protein